jgi:hypothetical protein
MTYTPEQIADIVLKVLKEIKEKDLIEISKNPNTPTETLSFLSQDNAWRVRAWVAQNLNTPLETLKILSQDECSSVSYWVDNNIIYNIATKLNLTAEQCKLLQTLIASFQNENLKNISP